MQLTEEEILLIQIVNPDYTKDFIKGYQFFLYKTNSNHSMETLEMYISLEKLSQSYIDSMVALFSGIPKQNYIHIDTIKQKLESTKRYRKR